METKKLNLIFHNTINETILEIMKTYQGERTIENILYLSRENIKDLNLKEKDKTFILNKIINIENILNL